MSKELRVGGKVRVFDGSYSMKVTKEGLVHTFGDVLRHSEFTILAFGQNFPADPTYPNEENDTIIHAGELVVFVQRRFLTPITRYCPQCGHTLLE